MSKDIATAVVALVRDYAKVTKDTNDVDGLIDIARRLSTYKVGLAVRVSELYRDKVQAEFQRKAQYDRIRKDQMTAGLSATAADIEARAAISDLLQREAKTDTEYHAGRLILDHSRDVLETLRQHIAELRQDKRNVNLQN